MIQQQLLKNLSKTSKIERYKELRNEMIILGLYDSPPEGSLYAKYMFIGIRPGRSMTKSTRTNGILEPLIKKYIGDSYYFTNVVKYPDSNNFTPSNEEAAKSIDILKKEIEIINPVMIISLGNWVFNILKKYDIITIKIPHPAFIARNNLMTQYEKIFRESTR